jgi:hypothetical protein
VKKKLAGSSQAVLKNCSFRGLEFAENGAKLARVLLLGTLDFNR